jgi:Ca-activated chloride channel homolog
VSFASPIMLLTLLVVPIAVAGYLWVQRRRVRYAARFTNLDLLGNIVDSAPGWRRHLPPALAIAALAALAIALARPHATVAVAREQSTVVLAMDSSASMTATDVEPTRLDAATSAASAFVNDLPERFRVGLVSFSSSASVLQAPTRDRESVIRSLQSIQGDAGTALGDAILRSVELAPNAGAAPSGSPFSVLLLSDGANSAGADPMEAVAAAKRAGVQINTIAFGNDAGTVEVIDDTGVTRTVPVPPDPATLRQIAAETGGRYFEAPTAADLRSVYEQIGSQVAHGNEDREITAVFAGAGGVLLLIGGALSALWFGRIP